MPQIPETQDPNIQPDPPCMRLINFRSGRGRQALHAVTTSAEQYRAENIDEYVQSTVQILDASTVSLSQNALGAFISGPTPDRYAGIDDEHHDGPCCKVRDAKAPSTEAISVDGDAVVLFIGFCRRTIRGF